MKTFLSIAFVGSVSMIGLLEIGIQRGLKSEGESDAPAALESAAGEVLASAALSGAHGFSASPGFFGAPDGGRKLYPMALGGSEDPGDFPAFADILPHILPKGAPRFSRLVECARLREGTGPLRPELHPAR